MTDQPNWTHCRYADMCSEEGLCSSGCEIRQPGSYMRHAPNPVCECHDCIRAEQLKDGRTVEAPSSANQQMDPESSAALATQGVQL